MQAIRNLQAMDPVERRKWTNMDQWGHEEHEVALKRKKTKVTLLRRISTSKRSST